MELTTRGAPAPLLRPKGHEMNEFAAALPAFDTATLEFALKLALDTDDTAHAEALIAELATR